MGQEVLMRCFVALEVPAHLGEPFRAVRWPKALRPSGQWHLTLSFLGDVSPERLGEVEAALARAVQLPPFLLELAGGGGFPTLRHARVLWVGTRQGTEHVNELANAVRGAIAPLSPTVGHDLFRPHVTVARVRGAVPPNVVQHFEQLGSIGMFDVTEVVLFESRPTSTGVTHTALHRYPLSRP